MAVSSAINIEKNQALHLKTLDEFYGCLYVSERLTLGGNIIQSAMLKIHGETSLGWTQCLNPYGKQLMPMWQSLCSGLLEEINIGTVNVESVIDGAEKTYKYMLDLALQLGFSDKYRVTSCENRSKVSTT